MEQIERLIDHIIARVNINLRKPLKDVGPYITDLVPLDSYALYYAFYALTPQHPLYFQFAYSSLAGTYFLGKCCVKSSVLYKSDIRGDELKPRGSEVNVGGIKVKTVDDEVIDIENSFLIKTLVHNKSHDPENLELFKIRNTVALHYANIHGSLLEGCFLEPFATVDLSICRDCVVGAHSYVQSGEISHQRIPPGRIRISAKHFEFSYDFPKGILARYISFDDNNRPIGKFIQFYDDRKEDFIPIYASISPEVLVNVPEGSFVSPYALVKPGVKIGKNVLVAQRAYVEGSTLGDGANAQENCYIIDSIYDGDNVTAHGGKVVNCHLGKHVFVGFNSFLEGKPEAKVKVGQDSIVMPHTIIDAVEPIDIPPGRLVWGFIKRQKDLKTQSIGLDELAATDNELAVGAMRFSGSGKAFVEGFAARINHILEENGAFFDGDPATRGHAQKTQDISFNILQPYPEGEFKGMCPEMVIGPLSPL